MDAKDVDINAIIREQARREREEYNEKFFEGIRRQVGDCEYTNTVEFSVKLDFEDVRYTRVKASQVTDATGDVFHLAEGYGIDLTQKGEPSKRATPFWRNLNEELAERLFRNFGRI